MKILAGEIRGYSRSCDRNKFFPCGNGSHKLIEIIESYTGIVCTDVDTTAAAYTQVRPDIHMIPGGVIAEFDGTCLNALMTRHAFFFIDFNNGP